MSRAIDTVSLEAPLRLRDTLQVLLNTRGYSASEILLRRMVRELGGYALSGEQMRIDMHWLADRALVRLHEVKQDDDQAVLFATLIERGRDVAQGDERVAGIEPPDIYR